MRFCLVIGVKNRRTILRAGVRSLRFSSVGSCATEKYTLSNCPYRNLRRIIDDFFTDSACPVLPVLTVSYSACRLSLRNIRRNAGDPLHVSNTA